MEYIVGIVLGIAACGLGTVAGFERDRALYPVMMVVIASYYGMFAALGGDARALGVEVAISIGFIGLAVIGFRTSLWVVAAAILGHAGFDLIHGHVVANAGMPPKWPMFCATIDAFIAAYLAWRLLSNRVDARHRLTFASRIRGHVTAELETAQALERAGDPGSAFRHLERAHVLGQQSTVQHVRVHIRMLAWGLRQHDAREILGQVGRVIGAALGTWAGLVPHGNTGGANVNGFRSMRIPDDLADLIDVARLPKRWLA